MPSPQASIDTHCHSIVTYTLATNHVSCMTKLEIRRVLPRIIKDMCLLSIVKHAARLLAHVVTK